MDISQDRYMELIEKLDKIAQTIDKTAQTSGWEIANVIATFCAVAIALFFPLREYLRLFPNFSIKIDLPEFVSGFPEENIMPHVNLRIKNLSKEVLYVKDAYLFFHLKAYRNIWIPIHLGIKNDIKLLPYSEECVDFFIWNKEANSTYKPIQEFLSTNEQIAEQYLEGITGYEKVKKVSFSLYTNLGKSQIKLPKWSWSELADQIFCIALTLDEEYNSFMEESIKNIEKNNIKEKLKSLISNMKKLDQKRRREYKKKCKEEKLKEKESKKRYKEFCK